MSRAMGSDRDLIACRLAHSLGSLAMAHRLMDAVLDQELGPHPALWLCGLNGWWGGPIAWSVLPGMGCFIA